MELSLLGTEIEMDAGGWESRDDTGVLLQLHGFVVE